jgi:hypothetical protein
VTWGIQTPGARMKLAAWGLVMCALLLGGLGPPAPAGPPGPVLRIAPPSGPVGTRIHISGEGFPPRASVAWVWETVDGRYRTRVDPENVVFYGYAYDRSREVVLGRSRSDGAGRVDATVQVPEDVGESHALDAVVGDRVLAQGRFRVMLSAAMAPSRGPVGAPITITVHGIPSEDFKTTMALTYDNRYTGFISAVTTHGTARVRIRASGPVGVHVIDLRQASQATPYLNLQQSPNAAFPVEHSWTFTVTQDRALPPDEVEWPDPRRVARLSPSAPRTTETPGDLQASPLQLAPLSGPTGTTVSVRGRGLPPGTPVRLVWITASRGNRVTGRGWSLASVPLLAGRTGDEGSWAARVAIPQDLGGWHVLQLAAGARVLGAAPFYVTRSLVRVAPRRVREGQIFTVEIRGVGWTELDNGVAVTYDNAYTGFACGFNSRGDVTIHLRATGGPGVHLVDLYPMIYQGHGEPPWSYQVPQLTALEDAPGLRLGYALPIFRLAIQVVR